MWLAANRAQFILLAFCLLAWNSYAWAEDEVDLSEAEVTITQDEEGQRVEEYRIDGKLYLVKIIQPNGPPLVMIDQDGDGEFEPADHDPTANPPTSQWLLFEW